MLDKRLSDRVKLWIEHSINNKEKKELNIIIENAKTDKNVRYDLNDRFSKDLEFGTAGLRAKMESGTNRMNSEVIIRTSFGLSQFLLKKNKNAKAIIGYDARHNSKAFAKKTCQVFALNNIKTYMFRSVVPTPVLAFAVKYLGADVGVMITASHNPKWDNGYKVYFGDKIFNKNWGGSQIIPPFDSEIVKEIKKSPFADQIYKKVKNDKEIVKNNTFVLDNCVQNEYIKRISIKYNKNYKDLKIVYTAMHGVGAKFQLKVLKNAGFTSVFNVLEQIKPDPDFSTASFPNPEEKGALDLAYKYAKKHNVDIIIANDPDADRCSICCFDKYINDYRQLTGDEIGLIFGSYFAKKYSNSNKSIASSVVSSMLLDKIAKKNNINYSTTLTGFKWISKVKNLIYGYEEAIGYAVRPDIVLDKDGISAGLLMSLIAYKQKQANKTLIDILDEQARTYNLYLQKQLSIRFDSMDKVDSFIENFINNPPKSIDNSNVAFIKNMNTQKKLNFNGLILKTGDMTRLIVRPSGTETKVKFYIEIIIPIKKNDSLKNARKSGNEKLQRIIKELKNRYE
jgi:phosphomannomutase